MTGDSFIVSHYGLDGVREHFMPGNRRTGQGVREKRGFDTQEEARAFIETMPRPTGSTYRCKVCGKWHIASPKRQ